MVEDRGDRRRSSTDVAGRRILLPPRRVAPRVSLSADAAAIATVDRSMRRRCARRAATLRNIIYTSGTTGRPKGTLLPHRGIARLVTATNYMQLGPADVMAQMASPAVRRAGLEVWGARCNGARLAIMPRETSCSTRPRCATSCERSGDHDDAVHHDGGLQQVARVAPDALRGVRNIFFGGEAADLDAVRRVREHCMPENLRNAYGPSEVSVFSTSFDTRDLAPDAATMPIGRPIANTRVYVLDARQRPCRSASRASLHRR